MAGKHTLMEKLFYRYYNRLAATLLLWKDQVILWFRKNQYRIFFLAFACMVIYTKDFGSSPAESIAHRREVQDVMPRLRTRPAQPPPDI